jgi:hypothetical protein
MCYSRFRLIFPILDCVRIDALSGSRELVAKSPMFIGLFAFSVRASFCRDKIFSRKLLKTPCIQKFHTLVNTGGPLNAVNMKSKAKVWRKSPSLLSSPNPGLPEGRRGTFCRFAWGTVWRPLSRDPHNTEVIPSALNQRGSGFDGGSGQAAQNRLFVEFRAV